MIEGINRYIDPLTDFGFKHLFGNEPDKDILIEFLNDLFQGEKKIIDLSYSPTEHGGSNAKEKKVFFDLTCIGNDGEQFIIEMQRTGQEFLDTGVYFICPDSLVHSYQEETLTGTCL